MTGNHHYDNQHHAHRHNTIDHFHNQHRPTTSTVPSFIHDYERQNQITINANSIVHAGPSRPPLIHPSTNTSSVTAINSKLQRIIHCNSNRERNRATKRLKTKNIEVKSTNRPRRWYLNKPELQ